LLDITGIGSDVSILFKDDRIVLQDFRLAKLDASDFLLV